MLLGQPALALRSLRVGRHCEEPAGGSDGLLSYRGIALLWEKGSMLVVGVPRAAMGLRGAHWPLIDGAVDRRVDYWGS